MRKYIGLTMFLIGALILVYLIFFTFGLKTNKSSNNNIVSTGNIEATQSGDKQENQILETDNQVNNNSGSIDSGNTDEDYKIEVNNNQNTIDNTLIIGNMTLYLVNDDKYDDIFEILGIGDLPKYKIEGKDIYVKKLDSVDYESEKVNIEQLIQKIGGNIANVNWFGDKQLFVNLDPYYKKDSISLVEYKGNVYIMVLPYNKYYEYEKVIKEFLFNK